MTTGLRLLKPITISDAMLTSSNVPEPAVGADPDPAAWGAATTYAVDARVHVVSTHTIYESVQAGNLNHDPTTDTTETWWVAVGFTNRWRMFDQRNSSQTTLGTLVDVTVTPSVIYNSVALLNVTNSSTIRIRMTDPSAGVVYDETTVMQAPPSEADHYVYCFEAISVRNSLIANLPSYRLAALRVEVNSASTAGVGVMSVGTVTEIGNGVHAGVKLGIQDYSIKTKNDYGDYEIVERAFAKRASFEMHVPSAKVDAVQELMASVRAVPCVWIGSDRYASSIIFGFYKDFDLTIAWYDTSVFTLTLEGLT